MIVDQLCDEFEAEWKAGSKPGISPYLKRAPKESRSELARELILIEVEYRRKRCEPVSPQDYRRFGQGGIKLATRAIQELDGTGTASGLSRMQKSDQEKAAATAATVVQSGTRTVADNEPQGDQGHQTMRKGPSKSAKVFGRFEIVGELGTGSFGRVSKAWDPHLERHVALKTPSFGKTDEKQIARFLGEAKSAGRLKHQNIVSVLESGLVEDKHFIASELVEGEGLGDWIDGRKTAIDEAVAMTIQLADALHYAHEEGVVHRDIKPDNIMISETGCPYIMDFGLAKRADDDQHVTTEGALLGTPAYMSPEQARGETNQVGPASDQYSLAIVLYHILCGRPPFEGPAHKVVMDVAVGNVPSIRSWNRRVDRSLERVIKKAMASTPDERYGTCEEFRDALSQWQNNQSRPSRFRQTKLSKTAVRKTTKRSIILGLGLISICLLTTGGWLAWDKFFPGTESTSRNSGSDDKSDGFSNDPAFVPPVSVEGLRGNFVGFVNYKVAVPYVEQRIATRTVEREDGALEQQTYTYTVTNQRFETRTSEFQSETFPAVSLKLVDGGVGLQVENGNLNGIQDLRIDAVNFTIPNAGSTADESRSQPESRSPPPQAPNRPAAAQARNQASGSEVAPSASQSADDGAEFLAVTGDVFEQITQMYTVQVPMTVLEQVPYSDGGETKTRTIAKTVYEAQQRTRVVPGIPQERVAYLRLPTTINVVPTVYGTQFEFQGMYGKPILFRTIKSLVGAASRDQLQAPTIGPILDLTSQVPPSPMVDPSIPAPSSSAQNP